MDLTWTLMCIVCAHANTSNNKCPVRVFHFLFKGFAGPKRVQQCSGTALAGVLCSWLCGLNPEEVGTIFVYLAQIWLLNLRTPPNPLWYFERYWYLPISVPGSRGIFLRLKPRQQLGNCFPLSGGQQRPLLECLLMASNHREALGVDRQQWQWETLVFIKLPGCVTAIK